MLSSKNIFSSNLFITILLVLLLVTFAACSSSSSESEAENEMESGEMEEMEHEEGDEHSEEEHEKEHTEEERVANDGATIAVTAPESGTTYGSGEEVTIEVLVEQFTLGEEGNHWHVYVDGTSWGMVVGDRTEARSR